MTQKSWRPARQARHSLSGQSAVWWMDGYVLKYGELGTPLADTSWKLVGPR